MDCRTIGDQHNLPLLGVTELESRGLLLTSGLNYFVVDSPLQVLNAREARHDFDLELGECRLLILDSMMGLGGRQMREVASMDAWANVSILEGGRGPGHLRRARVYRALARLVEAGPKPRRGFLGDLERPAMRYWARASRCPEIWWLEDGLSLVSYVNWRRHQPVGGSLTSRAEKWVRRAVLGWDDRWSGVNRFFTIHDIPLDEGEQKKINRYRLLRSEMTDQGWVEESWFVGQPLSEDGILDRLETELDCLAKVGETKEGKNLVYMAHRRDSKKKLNRIRELLGWRVESLNKPLELVLAVDRPRPRSVSSFFSSCLSTLRILFREELELRSYRIPRQTMIPGLRRDMVEYYYEYYGKLGIQTVRLS